MVSYILIEGYEYLLTYSVGGNLLPQAQLFRDPDAPEQPRANDAGGGDDVPVVGAEVHGPILPAAAEPDEQI